MQPPPKSDRDPTFMPLGTTEGIKKRQIVTKDDVENLKTYRDDGVTRILKPEDDPAFAHDRKTRVCGDCRNFNLEAGQTAIKDQRFIERMALDERWRAEWFTDWTKYGMCDHFEGRLVPATHNCLVTGSDLHSDRPVGSNAGMEKLDCEFYEDRGKRGDKMAMSRSGKRTWDHNK